MRSRDYWSHNPAFQWIGDRKLLCLLCARVVSTNAMARKAHENGIEHRSALVELREMLAVGRKAS